MAVKTFTTGEVLTAADTNTYLNNGGLVYITQASATSGATLSVDNCFSSTYSNYRIMIDNFQPATAAGTLYLRLRVSSTDASGANYNYGLPGLYADGTSSATSGTSQTFLHTGMYNSVNTVPFGHSIIDLFGPNRAERTYCSIQASLYNLQFGGRSGFGQHDVTTAYTGFTIYPSAGNFTNVRVWVYGYRNS